MSRGPRGRPGNVLQGNLHKTEDNVWQEISSPLPNQVIQLVVRSFASSLMEHQRCCARRAMRACAHGETKLRCFVLDFGLMLLRSQKQHCSPPIWGTVTLTRQCTAFVPMLRSPSLLRVRMKKGTITWLTARATHVHDSFIIDV